MKPRHAVGVVTNPIGKNMFFYNNSMSVMKRALTERLYFVKDGAGGFKECPRPVPGAFDQLLGFRNAVVRKLPAQPPVWTNEEFVQSYTGPRQARYKTAAANLMLRGIRRRDGYLKTFIKAEWYDGTDKSDPCPRLIQPRSYEYNVAVGRYLRPAEKLVYKAIDRVFGHHVVLKCDAPWKRAETILEHWGQFEDPVFVGMDASRFDQHVSGEALGFEHGLYNTIFKSKELARLLSWQVDQVGYANLIDGALKYTVEGCRGSGDMNTALGNVFLMCAISYEYLSKLGVKYRFIDDGDDCGFFIERRDLGKVQGLEEHYLKFGFEMEVEQPVDVLERVEFCQSRPVQLHADHWMMIRNVHKCLKQDALIISSRDWATATEVRHATGVCGLALYEGVPVLDAWYRSFLSNEVRLDRVERVLQDPIRSWRSYATQKRPYEVNEVVARNSLYRAFDIAPDHQAAMEDEFRATKFGTEKRAFNTNPRSRLQYYLD